MVRLISFNKRNSAFPSHGFEDSQNRNFYNEDYYNEDYYNALNDYNENLYNEDFYSENYHYMPDNFFSGAWRPSHILPRDTFKIDVRKTDNQYLVDAELPGIKKEEIKLRVENGILYIFVFREKNTAQNDKDFVYKERHTNSMSRSISLANARPDGIKAKLEHGVLSVIVLKQEKTNKSTRIDIE